MLSFYIIILVLGQLPPGQLHPGQFPLDNYWGAIIRWTTILGGNCLGDNCPGRNYPGVIFLFPIILSFKEIRLDFNENKTFFLILILSFREIKLSV